MNTHAVSHRVVSGLATGRYANGAFAVSPAGTFAASSDDAPLPAGSLPRWGPPAIYVTNGKWSYRGSTATADYYGGVRPGTALSIGANGAVSYTDRSLNFYNVSGLYSGGVFQNLPVVIRGVRPDGRPWSSWPVDVSYPAAITVNGQPWYYSSTASNSGSPTFLGPQSGQMLTLSGTTATIYDPTTSTYLTGSFVDGKFNFAGSTVSILAANEAGTPLDPIVPGSSGNIVGNLDVSGNVFTLGSWPSGGDSVNGLTLLFEDNPKLLRFESLRPATDWIWTTTATTTSGAAERMRITAGGKVVIGSSGADEKLEVHGSVKVKGVLRTDRAAGDISMGGFTTQPAP